MASPTESETGPILISRVRRVSRSGFLYEQNSKAPRLDKMIAHIHLYDQSTKCIEEDLQKQREGTLAQKRMGGARPRPQMGPRATEYEHKLQDEQVPQWVTELSSRPVQPDCVVTEVEEVDDLDAD